VVVVAVSLLNHYITRVYEHERTEEGLCKDVSAANTRMMQGDRRPQRHSHLTLGARYAASAGRDRGLRAIRRLTPQPIRAVYGGWRPYPRLATLSDGDGGSVRRRFGAARGDCGGLRP
jgi:hypothetical protein